MKMYNYLVKVCSKSKDGKVIEDIVAEKKAVRFRTAAYRAVEHVTRWGRLEDETEIISMSIVRREEVKK